jgi:hypothetical protein
MCVAGLLYERSSQKKLNRKWKAELRKAGISYFHMREFCHRQGQFAGKNTDFCDRLHKSLVGVIKQHIAAGASVITIPEKEFDEIRGKRYEFSQYTTCAFICMQFLLHQARKLNLGQVHFVIESGHRKQGELARLIDKVRSSQVAQLHPMWSRFAAYGFHSKKDVPTLQTADALAYELVKHERNQREATPRKMRGSLREIFGSTKNWTIRRLEKPLINHLANLWQGMPKIP